ncbi:hypothetical protein GPECTOR_14g227 [Gonium pectorale]|uniref:Sulfotransferase n=1 Tax=Gonium pectorale TaxID=33097 RepID=A0A150GMK2_GONPE|nr:hypothetical protein GPECTOR_14g227 [Gonium pectorale]|eukprot:KXZ50985.1 hypothetical protein GPECTOR_14g227 [Gonium pectorale]
MSAGEQPPPPAPFPAPPRLKVIGAGFGRTGTLSLLTALNQLGYKTHHMIEVFGKPGQVAAWRAAVADRAAGRPLDWRRLLSDTADTSTAASSPAPPSSSAPASSSSPSPSTSFYDAVVDWPSVAFFRELLAANPDAQVVLTTRDFDSWYASAARTIYPVGRMGAAIRPPPYLAPWFRSLTEFFALHEELMWGGTFGGKFEDREHARKAGGACGLDDDKVYEAHVAEVRSAVPPGQLLEFSVVCDGWGPLCAFLGRPPPAGDPPFPHENDTAEFARFAEDMRRRAKRLAVLFAASNAALAAAVATAAVLLVNAVVHRRHAL